MRNSPNLRMHTLKNHCYDFPNTKTHVLKAVSLFQTIDVYLPVRVFNSFTQ